jgi:hypothetical protein
MTAAIQVTVVVLMGITFAVCGVASTVKLQRIVADVNSKLPADQQFSPLWWHAAKVLRLFNDYRRLYPDGGRIDQLRNLNIIPFVVMGLGTLVLDAPLFVPVLSTIVGSLGIWLIYKRW